MNQTVPSTSIDLYREETRLPWHQAIEERFKDIGVTRSSWKVITDTIFPTAKSIDTIVMALEYVRARKLDLFKRPVNIVSVWDSKAGADGTGGFVDQIWPSIAEMRTTAFRTKQYAGCDATVFGPMITKRFTGKVKDRGQWVEKTTEVTFPEWGQITLYRTLGGVKCIFVGPKVYWVETYATLGRSDLPNSMWEERPSGQLEKCIEAAALRKAFPEELGTEYAAEEMEGKRIIHADDEPPVVGRTLTLQDNNRPKAPPPPPPPAQQAPQAIRGRAPPPPPRQQQHVQEAEVIDVDGVIQEQDQPELSLKDRLLLELKENVKSRDDVNVFQAKNINAILDMIPEEREAVIEAIQIKKDSY